MTEATSADMPGPTMVGVNANNRPAFGQRLLDVRGLSVVYTTGRSKLRAVDDVDLTIDEGETLGLVGESGSGKSTIGRAILGLVRPDSGSVLFGGEDLAHARPRDRRRISRQLQVIFQDPNSSLNPTRTIGQSLREVMRGSDEPEESIKARMDWLLQRVGLDKSAKSRYPLSFSGGQNQRIAIARALMVQPRLVICDEAVSALDLSVQAEVLNLLSELQAELGVSYLFISHDLAVVQVVARRIAVLYRGRVVEHGDTVAVCGQPRHPYTKSLLAAVLKPDPDSRRERRHATDSRFGLAAVETGCRFSSRCTHAAEVCLSESPNLLASEPGHYVACHRWQEI